MLSNRVWFFNLGGWATGLGTLNSNIKVPMKRNFFFAFFLLFLMCIKHNHNSNLPKKF